MSDRFTVSPPALRPRHRGRGLADRHDDRPRGPGGPGAGGRGHPPVSGGAAGVLRADLPAHHSTPFALRDGAGDHAGAAHVPPALPAGPGHDAAQPPLHGHGVSEHRGAQQGGRWTGSVWSLLSAKFNGIALLMPMHFTFVSIQFNDCVIFYFAQLFIKESLIILEVTNTNHLYVILYV